MGEEQENDRVEFQYVDVKGLQLVRRDNTPHVREVLKELLDVVLESSESGPAIDLARDRAIELLTGDVSMEKLTLSQSLSDSYKVKGAPVSITAYDEENQRYLSADINMAHVQVMHKMRERKPGSEPQSGDRVPYVLVKTDDPNAKAFEKAEDPRGRARIPSRLTIGIISDRNSPNPCPICWHRSSRATTPKMPFSAKFSVDTRRKRASFHLKNLKSQIFFALQM